MANYLNRPSIFEIATAFEDGNNGYVSKQKEYENVYNQLNDKEKSLSWRHPFIKENREKAFRATSHFDGIEDRYGDAIRHCYWCALNQVSAGLNSPNAKKFGDSHEDIPNNNAKAMDLHNNSVGYYLGNQAIINEWSEEELLNAANNGELKIGL